MEQPFRERIFRPFAILTGQIVTVNDQSNRTMNIYQRDCKCNYSNVRQNISNVQYNAVRLAKLI